MFTVDVKQQCNNNKLVTGWEQGRSESPSEAVVILVFHIDNCLLGPYGCWKWDARAVSQWTITCDVQPEHLHSVDQPPRPTLCPLFEQFQEVGDGFVKTPLISLAWRRAFCLWWCTGSVNSSVSSGLPFCSWTLRAS